jgi:hypothetical protein
MSWLGLAKPAKLNFFKTPSSGAFAAKCNLLGRGIDVQSYDQIEAAKIAAGSIAAFCLLYHVKRVWTREKWTADAGVLKK